MLETWGLFLDLVLNFDLLRLVFGMFLELKVWKFWGFAKFSNLVKGMDLNLETLN